MIDHITDLTKKIEKSDVSLHIQKTDILLDKIKRKFEDINKKVHGLSESTQIIHANLDKSRKLIKDLNLGLHKQVIKKVV